MSKTDDNKWQKREFYDLTRNGFKYMVCQRREPVLGSKGKHKLVWRAEAKSFWEPDETGGKSRVCYDFGEFKSKQAAMQACRVHQQEIEEAEEIAGYLQK